MKSGEAYTPATISDVHLTLKNADGSVQHYYHFLFGFLVPLVEVWNSIATLQCTPQVLVRSCALMDHMLHELKLPGLVILNAAEHAALREQCIRGEMAGERVFVTAEGYDAPPLYKPEVFRSVKEQLFFRLCDHIRTEVQAIADVFQGAGPRVVIIDRAPPDKFYSSPECELPCAGAERRSIANMEELCASVRRRFKNVLATTLEGRSLYYQMALFSLADIVICQHGAALANLIWARKGTQAVEIIPREKKKVVDRSDFFGDLARCMGLKCERLWQDSPHGPVATAKLLEMLQHMKSAYPESQPDGSFAPGCHAPVSAVSASGQPGKEKFGTAGRFLRRFCA
jgi:Glycosyltransferase 61